MGPIDLKIDRQAIDIVESLLLKMKASELSELRRIQTQLSVYGERRANMAREPTAVEARLEVLDDLLDQLKAQR